MLKKKVVINLFIVLITLIFIGLQAQNLEEIPNENEQNELADRLIEVSFDYHTELIKFYINEQEYNLALSYLDSIFAHPNDSLYFLKGLALKGRKEWMDSADNFAFAMKTSRSELLLQKSKNEFQQSLYKMPAMDAISLLSTHLSSIEEDDLLVEFLVIMADIYEENQLFDEANDIYATILKETNYPERIPVQMKIATNQLFLEQYEDAINTLSPIVALNDSIYNAEALFFYYLANYSADRRQVAKNALLKLYRNYPQHPKRSEVLSGLADVFEKEGQLIMSWYFLNEFQKISSKAQKFLIQKEIDQVKEKIATQKFIEDQFKYFTPNLYEKED